MDPATLKFSKSHEWLHLDGEIATVGITDFAQGQLGDIVFVELPEVGETLEKGQVFGTVEAVKTVAELYAPTSGEIVEVNLSLEDKAEQINSDPYGAWMVRMRCQEPEEMDHMLSPQDYAELIADL